MHGADAVRSAIAFVPSLLIIILSEAKVFAPSPHRNRRPILDNPS
jgi:hypothetical protein